jgi:myo-inositol 2-dehydrogenase / D-chiro-inositol 1-dehydrogenase
MNPIPSPTNRRRFLSTTGLTTAALAMPHIARAQNGSGSKLRIGIIGCGGRSSSVGEMAIKDGRFEVVALADYFQEATDRQGEKFKVPADRRYTGLNCFRKLLDAGGIDIAAVLSPPESSARWASARLKGLVPRSISGCLRTVRRRS